VKRSLLLLNTYLWKVMVYALNELLCKRQWINNYLLISRGGLAGYHYVAFTKIPRGCIRSLGFLNAPHSFPRGRTQAWQSEPHTPTPINGMTAKRTTPRSSNYSAKSTLFHPHGCTVFPGGHPTNRSLRRGTRKTARAPLNATSITS
jgi:hypothetical protein